jgi:hypothetical protein
MKRDPSDGFRHLVDNGLAEFTAEHVVVSYHDRFSAEAVECARRRLADFGIELPREAAVSNMAGVGNQDA